jgi:hypothetical protein
MLPYAKDQRCLPSSHFTLKTARVELAHSWQCCSGSKGLPCLNHVSASQCSSSHRQSSNQRSSLLAPENVQYRNKIQSFVKKMWETHSKLRRAKGTFEKKLCGRFHLELFHVLKGRNCISCLARKPEALNLLGFQDQMLAL